MDSVESADSSRSSVSSVEKGKPTCPETSDNISQHRPRPIRLILVLLLTLVVSIGAIIAIVFTTVKRHHYSNGHYSDKDVTGTGSGNVTGTIKDINHVVLFMQENRAFDHYFGTMAGVRGFKDPNVHQVDNRSIFYQQTGSLTSDSDYLLPWYLNYLHGDWDESTQCALGGDNGWTHNHAALNNDQNDMWAVKQTPWSWSHFTRNELPAHFAIAEGWTVGDMYQESEIASTNPNRIAWISGSINSPGSPQKPNQGGMMIDNNEIPGCDHEHINCYPLKWSTFPEHLTRAGVTWQVYQDADNFDDNPLAFFKQFQRAPEGSDMHNRGLAHIGLERFYKDAAAGKLPAVSIIVGPTELSEHAPHLPRDGGWLQAKVVDAVIKSPLYPNTALLISYDESGGWGDHVVPYHSPEGTPGEWVADPWATSETPKSKQVFIGPGFRVPFYIVSPWTRGGHVYTSHADHSSQLMFLERWLAAKDHAEARTPEIPAWRRANMQDLTDAFDFANPDYTLPTLPNVTYPSTNSHGVWNGHSKCEEMYAKHRPPPPFGEQNETTALAVEEGFKGVRGRLTEGRWLVFEQNGFALTGSTTSNGTSRMTFAASKSTAKHESPSQRFVLKEVASSSRFELLQQQPASSSNTTMSGPVLESFGEFIISDLGGGSYSVTNATSGQYVSIDAMSGKVVNGKEMSGFRVFSVSY